MSKQSSLKSALRLIQNLLVFAWSHPTLLFWLWPLESLEILSLELSFISLINLMNSHETHLIGFNEPTRDRTWPTNSVHINSHKNTNLLGFLVAFTGKELRIAESLSGNIYVITVCWGHGMCIWSWPKEEKELLFIFASLCIPM